MKAQEAARDRRRPALPGLAGSLMVGLVNVVPFGTTLARPLARTGPATRIGARLGASLCSSGIPLTPQTRRTSEEAHLRGCCGIRGDRSRRDGCDGQRGGSPQRRDAAAGVIGTFNSGAAEIEVPVLNRAPNGPVAMISPANTYVGLTHGGPGTAAGEPGKYYPTGKRNYARVVAADDFQGAADAILAKSLGVKKVYILNDKEAYGLGVATNFRNAAKKLGITVVGFTAWDGKASSYEATALKIKKSGAQGVFLGGLICENGGKLIKDLRAGAPNVKILAPDGFTPVSADVQQSSGTAEGMTVSVAGLPNEKLPPVGQAFVNAFAKANGGKTPDPYSVYAAAAAQVFLAAIGASDGSRASVSDQLFKVSASTVLGTIKFNQNGDVTSNPVTIYKIKGGKSA